MIWRKDPARVWKGEPRIETGGEFGCQGPAVRQRTHDVDLDTYWPVNDLIIHDMCRNVLYMYWCQLMISNQRHILYLMVVHCTSLLETFTLDVIVCCFKTNDITIISMSIKQESRTVDPRRFGARTFDPRTFDPRTFDPRNRRFDSHFLNEEQHYLKWFF